jgi:hypothetical protein
VTGVSLKTSPRTHSQSASVLSKNLDYFVKHSSLFLKNVIYTRESFWNILSECQCSINFGQKWLFVCLQLLTHVQKVDMTKHLWRNDNLVSLILNGIVTKLSLFFGFLIYDNFRITKPYKETNKPTIKQILL